MAGDGRDGAMAGREGGIGSREQRPGPWLGQAAVDLLARRGVTLEQMAGLVYELQLPYYPSLTWEECFAGVRGVVSKREVQYALITGLTLDEMAEDGSLPEPLRTVVRRDHPLYGIDSMLALAIVNMYGSIGMSNYGYLALEKDYLARWLKGRQNKVDTFLDDLVAAIIAAACARIAHGNRLPPDERDDVHRPDRGGSAGAQGGQLD